MGSTAQVDLTVDQATYDKVATATGKAEVIAAFNTAHNGKVTCTDVAQSSRRKLAGLHGRQLATKLRFTVNGKTSIVNSLTANLVPFAGCDATCVASAVVVSSSVDSSVSIFSSLALASVALAAAVSSALLH